MNIVRNGNLNHPSAYTWDSFIASQVFIYFQTVMFEVLALRADTFTLSLGMLPEPIRALPKQ